MPALLKYFLLTSLGCFFLASIPGLSFIGAMIWGAAAIYGGIRLNIRGLLPILGFNVLLLYMLAANGSFLFYLLVFGLAATVMGILASKRRVHDDIRKWAMIATLAGTTIFLGGTYLQSGDLGMDGMYREYESLVQDSLAWHEETGIIAIYEDQGLDRADLEAEMLQLAYSLSRHLPAIYYLEGILAVFGALLIASYQARRQKTYFLLKRPLIFELMPWQFAWFVILALTLFLLGQDRNEFLYYAGSNMLVISIPILVYYGIATLAFRVTQLSRSNKIMLAIFFILLFIIFPLPILVLIAIIGLFDSLLDYRKIRVKRGE